MSYKLVVSEKPSVAQAYAKVLGATNRNDGYLEGNGYLVSWCIGHLVELAPPNIHILRNQFSKAKICRGLLPKKREESSADFVYRVGSFSAVSFSSAKNISTFF